jgi:hypothetical protein
MEGCVMNDDPTNDDVKDPEFPGELGRPSRPLTSSGVAAA